MLFFEKKINGVKFIRGIDIGRELKVNSGHFYGGISKDDKIIYDYENENGDIVRGVFLSTNGVKRFLESIESKITGNESKITGNESKITGNEIIKYLSINNDTIIKLTKAIVTYDKEIKKLKKEVTDLKLKFLKILEISNKRNFKKRR